MRAALCLTTGLAVIASGVSASSAQDSRELGDGRSAGAGIEAVEPQTDDQRSDGPTSEAQAQAGTVVAVPIGRVSVGPEFVDGELIYVRRAERAGMAIVDVSTTPFAPEAAMADEWVTRPDQPALW